MSTTTPTDPKPTPPTTPEPQSPVVETPPAVPPAPVEPPAQETTDWKAEARKWESLAKKHKDAADRLDAIEEANKTEAQKQADALAAAEAKVKEFETREQIAEWKAEVSKETGVPANVLAGSTKEAIEAHAKSLKELIGTTPTPTPPAPGVVPTIGKTPENPANVSLADQIVAAEAAGNKALVSQLKAMQLGAATTT